MYGKVSVVLATYKPHPGYFKELLRSINHQSYENIELIIRDDSESDAMYEEIKSTVQEIVTRFPVTFHRNSINSGSNRTFELLSEEATGDYIAYCDQDDVWEERKVELLVNTLEKSDAILCYSDLSIIDGEGTPIANSFRDVNKRIKHMDGEGLDLFSFFIRRNCVTGCAMLIRKELLRDAIPFWHSYFVHDHWLALVASAKGRIAYVSEPLVKYRLHGNNQIGASMLKGLTSKDDYLSVKLGFEKSKYTALAESTMFNTEQMDLIRNMLNWVRIRMELFERPSVITVIRLLKFIPLDRQLTLFEIVIAVLPKRLGRMIINRVQS